MVIVRLQGGLGNQLFQYATGRALAVQRRSPLLLDTHHFNAATPRRYALEPFCIRAGIAPAVDPARVSVRPARFAEPCLRPYDPAIWETPRDVLLDGYWQSERYFSSIAGLLRDELRLRRPLDAANAACAARIRSGPAVSVHVRRGDYVTDAHTHAVHGTCTPAYYEHAMAVVGARVPGARFFIFSDDPAWTQAHVPTRADREHVTHNDGDHAHADLQLMRLCGHHIMANSSLSWWGAWLGERRGSLIIAPRTWFAGADYDTRDLIPARWMRLE